MHPEERPARTLDLALGDPDQTATRFAGGGLCYHGMRHTGIRSVGADAGRPAPGQNGHEGLTLKFAYAGADLHRGQ